MFDWIRGLTQSAEERRQERANAYVDGTLSQAERVQFEAEMARDSDLKQDVDDLRQIKSALSSMPRQRAPRNFTLDPAVYGKPQPAYDVRFYPVLQAATAISALVFLIMATLTLLPQFGASDQMTAAAPANQVVESVAESVMMDEDVAVESEPVLLESEVEADAEVMEEAAFELDAEEASMDSAESAASSAMMAEEAEPAADMMAADSDVADDSGMAIDSVPTALPTVVMQSREIVVPAGAGEDSAEDDGEFRAPPAGDNAAASSAVEERESAAPDAIVPTVEIAASDTAPESKTSIATEDVEQTTIAAEQSQTQPIVYWTIALALLFILLLATTLWVRSRL